MDLRVVVGRATCRQHPGHADQGAAHGRPHDGLAEPTSGSAGLVGGFLPVVARHVVFSPFLATAAAPIAATSENAE